MTRRPFILVALCLVITIASYAQKKFVDVKGKEIVTPDGKPMLIKGINLGNWLVPEGYMFKFTQVNAPKMINEVVAELTGPTATKVFWEKYLDSYITEGDIHFIKSTGANSIRLPFNYRLFTQEDYLGSNDSTRGFTYIDRVLGWCKKEGLYVLLDMHCAPGGQTGDNIDDSYGYPWLYTDSISQELTVAIWKRIAAHYSNNETVMGYDLLNEPIAHYYNTAALNPYLEPLFRKITGAIRKVDGNHLIFLEGAQWGSNFKIFSPPFDKKLVYQFHKYWTDTTQKVIQEYLDFRDKYNVPVYIGETGENNDQWITSFRRMLESNNVGWHFWPYKKMDAGSCMITFKQPATYTSVIAYAKLARTSYGDIRKARPKDMDSIYTAFDSLLQNCRFENCTPNKGYLGALGLSIAQETWQSKYVTIHPDGSLTYIPDEKGNVLPDFSRVGYYKNSKPLPTVPVVKTIAPAGDNSQQTIQAAIDELSRQPLNKDGFRGAILLQKGVYNIPGRITINASGIILRGEGDDTKLVATGAGKRTLVAVSGTGNSIELPGTRQKITDGYVPLGAKSFTVASAKGLKAGDKIMVFRPGMQNWISDLRMDQIEKASNTLQWEPREYDLSFERVVTRVEGNKVFIDNPVVMAMEDQYGGGEIYQYTYNTRINNVGIENIFCESAYNGDTDEDHGWDAITFNRIENSWITGVTSRYFGYSCVNLGDQSTCITVDHCKCLAPKSQIEGGRRYSFNNDGQLNLVTNCFASEGRHDYVTGARVRGPNVFYNCTAEHEHADIGPHHRWAMGTLYDNIVTDGEINAQDRGNWGTGHGWSGVNQVFWNCTTTRSVVQNPWVSGKNYVIGMKGKKYDGRLKGRPDTEWEGQNQAGLIPGSLYLAQLKEYQQTIKKTK